MREKDILIINEKWQLDQCWNTTQNVLKGKIVLFDIVLKKKISMTRFWEKDFRQNLNSWKNDNYFVFEVLKFIQKRKKIAIEIILHFIINKCFFKDQWKISKKNSVIKMPIQQHIKICAVISYQLWKGKNQTGKR